MFINTTTLATINLLVTSNDTICGSIEQSPIENALMPEYESIIYGKHGYILWGIVFVIIAFLGCIGNVLTIIVLKRESIISTLNILLIALAISDILAPQANALLAISFYHLESKYGNSINFLVFSDILRHIIQPLGTMFTMISSWIVTTTTLFRLIAVMWPFKARTLINRHCAIISLIIIFGFSLMFILPFYLTLIRHAKCTPDGKTEYVAFKTEVTSELMAKAYMPMLQTMCFYLPWLIALTLWIFLLRTLRRSDKNFNVSFVSKESNIAPLTNHKNFNNNNTNTNSNNNNTRNNNSVYKTNLSKEKRGSNGINDSIRVLNSNTNTSNAINHSIILNTESRISNVQTRQRSYNKITLMVVVLCFTNLICRVFTFVFIFEAILDQYSYNHRTNHHHPNGESNDAAMSENMENTVQTARVRFPKFLSYSLLLNNIFLAINHSSNIFIYIFTNPRFKKNLTILFQESSLCRVFSKKLANENKRNSVKHIPYGEQELEKKESPKTSNARIRTFNKNYNGDDHICKESSKKLINMGEILSNVCKISKNNLNNDDAK